MQQLLILILIAVTASGCVYSREIAGLRDDIEYATGTDFDREVVIVIGPRTFRNIGWLARRVPEPEARLIGEYIADIQRVKVGVYRADEMPGRDELEFDRMPRIQRRGWETLVRFNEDDEAVWVMYRERHDTVRDMLVVTVDDENLVVVRLQGYLDRMVERAVADRAFIRELAGGSVLDR